jgi:hypothetical protein
MLDTSTSEFIDRLAHLTALEICTLAASLHGERRSADDDLAWWRATVAVSVALRRAHRTRHASVVAHRAATAVVDAARRAGIDASHADEVTAVARAAGDAARMLVAGDAEVVPDAVSAPLLHAWSGLLPAA